MTFQLDIEPGKSEHSQNNIAAINRKVNTFGNLIAKVGDYIGLTK